MNIEGEGPKKALASAIEDRHRGWDTGSSRWDYPDGASAGSAPAKPRRTLLDRLVWVVKLIGIALLFGACLFTPGDGSDTSGLPGWYWMALGVTGATGGLLLILGTVYQRHRSPILDRPAWEAEGWRPPVRCYTRVQVEPRHFEVRDETCVVADDRSSRRPSLQAGDLRIAGHPYHLRRGSFGRRLFADGDSKPVLRVSQKGRITLDNGAIFIPARRIAPASRSWVAVKQYRMQRFTNLTGTEVMVLRWRESPARDGMLEAEARIYVSYDVSDLLPVICYALAQFQGQQPWRESR